MCRNNYCIIMCYKLIMYTFLRLKSKQFFSLYNQESLVLLFPSSLEGGGGLRRSNLLLALLFRCHFLHNNISQ